MNANYRRGLLVGLLLLVPCGCLQVEVTVQMDDDGGATITERVRFSAALLDLDKDTPADQQLAQLLAKEAVQERTKVMGKGARLVSHTVTDLPGGARESLAVYHIPDLEDLRLLNPYLIQGPAGRRMRFQFTPIYKFVHSFHRVGDVMLYLVPAETPRRRPRRTGAPPPEPTPAQLQTIRDLQPAFADMLEDFHIKLRLVATKPISRGYVRDRRARTKVINLISFSEKDLDAFASPFIENEELMLTLLRWRMDADVLTRHTRGFASNVTVPVFRGKEPYAVGRFRIKPTKHLFQKFYAGRPKSQGGDVEDKVEDK